MGLQKTCVTIALLVTLLPGCDSVVEPEEATFNETVSFWMRQLRIVRVGSR